MKLKCKIATLSSLFRCSVSSGRWRAHENDVLIQQPDSTFSTTKVAVAKGFIKDENLDPST